MGDEGVRAFFSGDGMGGVRRVPLLPLYELDVREPVAELDPSGVVHTERAGLPKILFADVPIMFHLTCGIAVGPMDQASDETGPERARGRDDLITQLAHALWAAGHDQNWSRGEILEVVVAELERLGTVAPRREALSDVGRIAVVAARSAVSDGREIGPITVGVLLAELDRFAASGGAREVADELLKFAGGEPDDPEQVAQWRQLLASMGVSLAELVVSAPVGLFDLLTGPQRRALREMLEEWVGEGFTTPPFSDAQYDIFEVLGVQSPIYDTKRP